MLYDVAIDIANWLPDKEFQNYPIGARPKTAVFPPKDCNLHFIKNSRRYLFKRSYYRYPDQFWCEIIAYYIGRLLSVQAPPAFVAYYSSKPQQQCGALIEWFYEDDQEHLVHGGEFLQSIIPQYDRKKGEQHNFQTVTKLCEFFSRLKRPWLFDQNWSQYWGEIFLFDTLIGNTDRHQDNWGFLFGASNIKLAPLFDNGTSLGHLYITWTSYYQRTSIPYTNLLSYQHQ